MLYKQGKLEITSRFCGRVNVVDIYLKFIRSTVHWTTT